MSYPSGGSFERGNRMEKLLELVQPSVTSFQRFRLLTHVYLYAVAMNAVMGLAIVIASVVLLGLGISSIACSFIELTLCLLGGLYGGARVYLFVSILLRRLAHRLTAKGIKLIALGYGLLTGFAIYAAQDALLILTSVEGGDDLLHIYGCFYLGMFLIATAIDLSRASD
jgi:hypothetical protein